MNQGITFSFDQLMGVATEGYAREANILANIAASRHFASLLPRFADYPKFMREDRGGLYGESIEKLYSGDGMGRELGTTSSSEVLAELFSCAHLAASCYMLNGVSITSDQLSSQGLNSKVNTLLKRILSDSPRNIRKLLHNLHNIDSIRTVHILKLAGLLDIQYESCRQLSLGAGHGSRDLASIHQVPVLNSSDAGQSSGTGGLQKLTFNSYCLTPKDVILSDNDPGLREYFEELNAKPGSGVKAIPEDTYEALEKVPGLLAGNELDLRNLVVVFRIDHRMLPDIPGFFRLLSAVIIDGADFILSIGAGHSLDEFRGRLEKISRISDFLNEKGIRTTRFRLYHGESAEEKRNNCAFGAMSYATYEILHCKLSKKCLS